jgi:hypothetical protein
VAKLTSPDGRDYETSDPTEITRLKAQGYTEASRPQSKAQAAPKPA